MKTAIELPSSRLLVKDGKRVVANYRAVYDTAKALRLLAHLNSLTSADGTPLARYSQWQGLFLYPQITEHIYWSFLVPYVMYEKAFADFKGEALDCRGGGLNLFGDLYHSLYSFPKQKTANILYEWGLGMARFRTRPRSFLFYEKSPTDFRTVEMRQTLARLGILHTSTDYFRTQEHLRPGLLCPPHLYLRTMGGFSPAKASPILPREHPEFPTEIQRRVLRYIQAHLEQGLAEIEVLERIFKKSSPRVVYGLDDHASAFCLYTVAAAHGIPMYGHQHGCISKIQPGWMRNHLRREDNNVRFNKLFVWGAYWKKKILQCSNLYDDSSLEIGGAMRPGATKSSKLPRPAAGGRPLILVPYEYLVDRVAVGEFMGDMVEKGWRVALKIRPDSDAKEQLANYEMKRADQVELVTGTPEDYLATVSAVAGCQSTLLFEWLARGMPAWYLKSGFTMQEDMVPDGLAHLVDHEVLDGNCETLFRPSFHGDPLDLVDSRIRLDDLIQKLAS